MISFKQASFMKHLTIVVPQGQHNLISILGSYMLFNKANQHWQARKGTPVFKVALAACSGEVLFHDGFFSVRPHLLINEIRRTDLVLIPAVRPDFRDAIAANQEIVAFISEQYKQGASVASICTGAFLLAATGLLNGHHCSTHWSAVNAFRKMFPGVHVTPDKVITDENGVYTNGGALSFFNLLLYLIEKYYDRETAVYCAKFFQIDLERASQSPFMIFSGQKEHDDEEIKQAQYYIEEHLHEKITVEDLARQFCLGRRSFDRRFKAATGNTPLEYLQRVRIEAAKAELEASRKTVQEIMYETGYCDIKAFRAVFRKNTGLSPLEYRNKFNKDVSVLSLLQMAAV